MDYIVLDLEWNQPQSYLDMVKDPVFLAGEIIQIGAVKLNQDLSATDYFDCRVCPSNYQTMHPKVVAITGLQTKDLKCGLSFADAYVFFLNGAERTMSFWFGEQRIFRFLEKISLHIKSPMQCFREVTICRMYLQIRLPVITADIL